MLTFAFITEMPAGGSTKEISLQKQQLSPGKSVSYIRVDLAGFDVRVLTPLVSLQGTGTPSGNPDRAAQGLYLLDYLNRYRALAVMSGGYIDSYSPPTALGSVKSNGTLIAPPHNSWLTNGIFCSDAGRAIVQAAGSDDTKIDLRDCVQAGPSLLNAGQAAPQSGGTQYLKLAESIQEQGFICIDGEGPRCHGCDG